MAELGLALRARLALADAEKGHYPFRNYRHARARRVLFVGCNVVSLYPRTVRAAVRVLAEREGMGYALDCCGAPLALAGKRTQAQRAAEGVVRRLSERGVEEAAFACPTCERSLRAPLAAAGIRSTSVYAALRRCGAAGRLAADGAVFPPCPDRREKAWLAEVLSCFDAPPEVLEAAPCCGLGAGGGPSNPGRAQAMAAACLAQAHEAASAPPYVYCASCAGIFSASGEPGVRFALSELLGVHERPQTASALANRARAKLW